MPVSTRQREGQEQSRLGTKLLPSCAARDDSTADQHQTTPQRATRKRSAESSKETSPVVTPDASKKPNSASKKPKRQSPKKPPVKRKAPENWEDVYHLVEELRKDRTAPCDYAGCEALAIRDDNNLPLFRFTALVALLLSSQTKDAVTAEAINTMKRDNILSVEALRRTEITEELLSNKYLAKVGFRNNKAKYLKQVVNVLHSDYGGDIPPNAFKMMELPGIGPKMAFICESVAWDPDTPSGIGVDTHMHRLFNCLGWVKSKTPEQTRVQLESWLPVSKWKTVNLLWVGFGQEVQQEKEKSLQKALNCSQPAKALRLLQRCGMDLKKEGTKHDLYKQIQAALKKGTEA